MSSNYNSVVDQLRGAGLVVDALVVSGRVVRCRVEGDRERRGWYVLHELRTGDGRDLIVGSFGVWRGADNGAQKIALDKSELTDDQRRAFAARMREDRRRADNARKADAKRAQRRAEVVWRKALHAPPGDQSPEYLRRKGIGGHGVRYTESGAVVIAMHDAQGLVHGLQFILSRERHAERIKKTGRDKEYWPRGLEKTGHFFLIGQPADHLLICEGYATAASLHEATGLAVAVAFDAGNLGPVTKVLRKRYPHAALVLCADDDFATKGNPGITAASAAAMESGGSWVSPVFSVEDQTALRARIAAEIDWSADDFRAKVGEILRHSSRGKLTDYNDLHVAEGLLTVRAQIEAKLPPARGGASQAARNTATGGEGSGARATEDWIFTIDRLLDHYALVYGTDTVFDNERRMVLGLGPLRSAAGKGLVRQWLEHPDRRVVLPEQVGFDPTGQDASVACNLWGGWPSAPKAGSCQHLLGLIEHLCSYDPLRQAELTDWLLKWIAYPLQHPGAKMATAVLMHGPEGTGKNTVFNAIRSIYGRYGCQFSQVELESNFNGWASGKLFAIGNEVVSRAELYHIQGRLKAMVTEPEWIINEKMLPARQEQNHCNFIFFSNRIDIAKLDQGDRRYCVIWTPTALDEGRYAEVVAELKAGGAAALHHHLMHLDLGDFHPHTKPPATAAKQELINLGMDSTDRFYRDWIEGDIHPLPEEMALSEDLYAAYRAWCQREGIGKAAQKQTLLTSIGKKPGVRKAQERFKYRRNGIERIEKRTVILTERAAEPDTGRAEWIGKGVGDFSAALIEYRQIDSTPDGP